MELFIEKTYILAMRELYQDNAKLMSGYPNYASIANATDAMNAALVPELATVYVLEVQGTTFKVQAERKTEASKELHECIFDYCFQYWQSFGMFPDKIVLIVEDERVEYTHDTIMEVLNDNDKFLIKSQAV